MLEVEPSKGGDKQTMTVDVVLVSAGEGGRKVQMVGGGGTGWLGMVRQGVSIGLGSRGQGRGGGDKETMTVDVVLVSAGEGGRERG